EDEPLEPGKLVVEFRARLRVAVGKVKAPYDDAVHVGLDVAAVLVLRIAGEDAPAFHGLCTPRKDRDAIPGLLAVPDRLIPGGLNVEEGKTLAHRFQFLDARAVPRLALEPLQQVGKARLDAVDVVGRY